MSRLQRTLLLGSTVAATLTGLAYACLRYLLDNDDPFSAYNHPAQPWALDLHVLVTPLLLLAVGWFWGNHVEPKIRRGVRSARRSGIVLPVLVVSMTLSGYLLQTTSHEGWRVVVAWTHGSSGVLFFLALAGHLLAGRRSTTRATARPSDGSAAPLESA